MINPLDIDELQMYFGEPYRVNDYITLTPPTVGDIIRWGEGRYYATVHTLTCIPSDMKSMLFDAGIDYEEISDFELFCIMVRSLTPTETSIFFGENLNFSELIPEKNLETDEVTLKKVTLDEDGNLVDEQVIIDNLAYLKISNYIRKLHSITPKVEHAANKTTKRILIQLDREKRLKAKDEEYKSQLLPLVSAMMRYPGFKYNSKQLKDCGIYEFMDTVKGAQIYVSSTALLSGSYSGFCDTSKIPDKHFNWMRTE